MTARAYREPDPVVYVIQDDPAKNMTQAIKFGSMEPVLQAREEVTPLNVPSMIAKIKFALRHMRPQDYLLCSGNPLAIGIAFAVAAEMTDGRFNALKWDGQEQVYWPSKINLHQGE